MRGGRIYWKQILIAKGSRVRQPGRGKALLIAQILFSGIEG